MLKRKIVNQVMETLLVGGKIPYSLPSARDSFRLCVQDPDCEFKRLSVIFLANLCQTPEGCVQLMQLNDVGGALKGLHLQRLIQWFLKDVPEGRMHCYAHESASTDIWRLLLHYLGRFC